jgi:hypothetical protein
MGPYLSSQDSTYLNSRPLSTSGSRYSAIVQDGCNLSQGISLISLYGMNHWEQIGRTFGSFCFPYRDT